jgi:acetylornithine/N-succinyldiaminopimelate aminotransferase
VTSQAVPDPLMHTYSPLPVAFERGEGAWLWDTNGKRYLDAVSGVAVCSLGHAHPAVAAAVCEQAGRLLHTSNLYEIPLQRELASQITELSGMDRAFFCNSGAEANEAAIKLARLHGHQKGVTTPTTVVAENSFHGRTLATLTATGNRRVQAGFEPLVQGFARVPYDDLEAIETVAANSPDVVAVLMEPVQGEGGVNVPDPRYLEGLRRICDQRGWLMMLDEVQTGMCRTGHWFGFQETGVKPDVVTLAKALGNGFPIGACLARGSAAEVLGPGNHATTFGGNPLACSATLAVIRVMRDQDLAARAAYLGTRILAGLRNALEGQHGVVAIRGKGLMLGVELDRPCRPLAAAALQRGLLINVTAERVVRLLPPLIITDDQAQQVVNGVAELVRAFLSDG